MGSGKKSIQTRCRDLTMHLGVASVSPIHKLFGCGTTNNYLGVAQPINNYLAVAQPINNYILFIFVINAVDRSHTQIIFDWLCPHPKLI